MKSHYAFWLGVFCSVSCAGETSTRTDVLVKLGGTFNYSSSSEVSPEPVAARGVKRTDPMDLVEMDAVIVTESIERRDLKKAINDQAAAEAEKEFSWNKGGLIGTKKIGHIDADLGLWPTISAGTPGKLHTEVIMLRVEVLRLRW